MKKISIFACLFFGVASIYAQNEKVVSKFTGKQNIIDTKKMDPNVLFVQRGDTQNAAASYVLSTGKGYYNTDDFQLATATEIKNMEFYGYQANDNLLTTCTGAALYIYADNNGAPAGVPGKYGTPLFSLDLTKTDPKFYINRYQPEIYNFIIDTSGFQAEANKKYWVVFAPKVASSSAQDFPAFWNWFFSPDLNFSDAKSVDPSDVYQAGLTNWFSLYDAYGSVIGANSKALAMLLYSYNYLGTKEKGATENAMTIAPNPASSHFAVTAKDFAKSEIYDMNGRLVKTSHTAETSVQELPKGTYMVKITTKNGEAQSKKLIKK